jgi:AcrR family transcriptional regulator
MKETMIEPENSVKKKIIDAAISIFLRYGYNKTTMEDIARAAKKAKSSIYHYFTSKEEIFKEIVEGEFRVLKYEMSKAVGMEDTPVKKMRAFILTRLYTIQKLGNFYSAVKDEYFTNYNLFDKLRKESDEEEIRFIKEILNGGIKDGIFVVKDVGETAVGIFTALKGLEYSWLSENDSQKIEKNLDFMLDILFYGIVKR